MKSTRSYFVEPVVVVTPRIDVILFSLTGFHFFVSIETNVTLKQIFKNTYYNIVTFKIVFKIKHCTKGN